MSMRLAIKRSLGDLTAAPRRGGRNSSVDVDEPQRCPKQASVEIYSSRVTGRHGAKVAAAGDRAYALRTRRTPPNRFVACPARRGAGSAAGDPAFLRDAARRRRSATAAAVGDAPAVDGGQLDGRHWKGPLGKTRRRRSRGGGGGGAADPPRRAVQRDEHRALGAAHRRRTEAPRRPGATRTAPARDKGGERRRTPRGGRENSRASAERRTRNNFTVTCAHHVDAYKAPVDGEHVEDTDVDDDSDDDDDYDDGNDDDDDGDAPPRSPKRICLRSEGRRKRVAGTAAATSEYNVDQKAPLDEDSEDDDADDADYGPPQRDHKKRRLFAEGRAEKAAATTVAGDEHRLDISASSDDDDLGTLIYRNWNRTASVPSLSLDEP